MKSYAVKLLVFSLFISGIFSGLAYAETCPDGPAMQQWRAQYQQLFRTADAYKRAGIGGKYLEARSRLDMSIAAMPSVFLEQEIRNYPLFGKTQCLLWAMNKASGQNLNLQPYSDGTFDLLIGDNKIRDRISGAELLSIAKSLR